MNDSAPEVWALTSYRAGETSQILALADLLGVPWQRVDINYCAHSGLIGLLRLSSRAGTSSDLREPWPRLLISAGLGNEPVARWIRQRSGGRTRLVFLGRTWASLDGFDLVVTTPQYRLRSAPNLIENPLTIHSVTSARLAQARGHWSARYAGYPGLQVGVLLGGDSGPYAFDESFATRLADQLNGLAAGKAAGKSVRLLITTSSRTPPGFLELLKSRLVAEYEAHAWGAPGENPYFGILAWADGLVVSADSIAMISEALATGKRVLLSEPTPGGSLRAAVYRSAMHWGHKRWTRDVALVHERLQKMGLIDWLPGGSIEPTEPTAGAVGTAYLEDTAAKVKQLLD